MNHFEFTEADFKGLWGEKTPKTGAQFWETLEQPKGKKAMMDILKSPMPQKIPQGSDGHHEKPGLRSARLCLLAIVGRQMISKNYRPELHEGIRRLIGNFSGQMEELEQLIMD